MTILDERLNRRVLVVDDEESVRDSFRSALGPKARRDAKLDAAASLFFDGDDALPEVATKKDAPEFEVDFAVHGKQALEYMQRAVEEERPYAVVFCDMRMPGWDGLETVEHLRRLDDRCEVIFVTAYSDHDIEHIAAQAGANVGYFLKPFATDEIRQLAIKTVFDWNKARELEELMRTVTGLSGEEEDLGRLLGYLLRQICDWLEAESGALVEIGEEGSEQVRLGLGKLAEAHQVNGLLADIPLGCVDGPTQLANGVTLLPIAQFGMAIVFEGKRTVTPDRLYLLRVFLEHASLVVRNHRMRQKLLQVERLGAVGQAAGFLVHDLRGPLGNIRYLAKECRDPESSGMPLGEVFDMVDHCAHDSLDLVDSVLDFCRGQVAVKPRPTALGQVIQEELPFWEMDLEGIDLVVSVPPDLSLRIDRPRFLRALRNLVRNAGEALAGRRDGRIEVGARGEGERAQVWVRDNGPGLPAEVRRTLFQPFSSEGKIGGTGFGLAIVRQLVEAHGGGIRAESSSDGTRFEIDLPSA